MNHGSLFSGIGGFDLAAEWMGWNNVFHCEWNEFGQRILKHYWPKAITYDDITKADFTIHRGRIDILTGGFPCQPYSTAGKRLGKEDDRHLWPEMLRAIREIAPRFVVGENVRGLINWNGGLVFEEVQADLEAEGYEVQPILLPAAGVGAPHRRDRIWFVAHANDRDDRRGAGEDEGQMRKKRLQERDEVRQLTESGKIQRTVADSQNNRFPEAEKADQWREHKSYDRDQVRTTPDSDGRRRNASDTKRQRPPRKEHRQTEPGQPTQKNQGCRWADFPTQPPICSRNDGLPDRLDGITFPKWRNESIKAYGNAIVPQVAYEIFKAIEASK